jgi:hypothetical protein
VGTVDSFQGQERDIIAITLTRSYPQGEIGFLSDIRRMNVGMTRARRKLLLLPTGYRGLGAYKSEQWFFGGDQRVVKSCQ